MEFPRHASLSVVLKTNSLWEQRESAMEMEAQHSATSQLSSIRAKTNEEHDIRHSTVCCDLLRELQVKSEEHPAIADQSDDILHVVTATGHKVRVMQTNLKIGGFAISPDIDKVVSTPLSQRPDLYGGQIFFAARCQLTGIAYSWSLLQQITASARGVLRPELRS